MPNKSLLFENIYINFLKIKILNIIDEVDRNIEVIINCPNFNLSEKKRRFILTSLTITSDLEFQIKQILEGRCFFIVRLQKEDNTNKIKVKNNWYFIFFGSEL